MGSDTLVWTTFGDHNFTFRAPSERTLKLRERITIGFDPARASLFDAATDARL
jgi:multiple sugar transport system ATP-binding protein